jgi:hypothetical protein
MSNGPLDFLSKPDAGFDEAIEVLAGTPMVGDGHADGIAAIQDGIGGSGDPLLLKALEELLV